MPGRITLKARAYRHAKPTGGMNRLERAYADVLEIEKLAGRIVDYRFDAIKLRLADKTFYTPDFLVIRRDLVVEFHEVKGFWEDDARVKIKVAADQHWAFKFVAVRRVKKQWVTEEFGNV